MVGSILLTIGLATVFNIVIIIHKIRGGRIFDAVLDMTLMMAICSVFSGTFSSLVVGMIGSMGVSLYLLFSPVYLVPQGSTLRTTLSTLGTKIRNLVG